MLFLLTDCPHKLKLEKVHGALIILFYITPSSSPLKSRFKETATTLQTLQFQDRISFFIKNTHTHTHKKKKLPLSK